MLALALEQRVLALLQDDDHVTRDRIRLHAPGKQRQQALLDLVPHRLVSFAREDDLLVMLHAFVDRDLEALLLLDHLLAVALLALVLVGDDFTCAPRCRYQCTGSEFARGDQWLGSCRRVPAVASCNQARAAARRLEHWRPCSPRTCASWRLLSCDIAYYVSARGAPFARTLGSPCR